MPDINPISLNRPDLAHQTSFNPSSLSLNKVNGISNSSGGLGKFGKTANANLQRVDLEPIYTSLKAAIAEHWGIYKESVGKFILGELNQSELSHRISHLLSTVETENLHNCLIVGIYANAFREPPEPGVIAAWVSANDKPSNGLGIGGAGKGGDKVEERLRREVMGLPARDRRRLKDAADRNAYDVSAQYAATSMQDYRTARTIKVPEAVPTSAGGFGKTNWEIEIRRRYDHSLFCESGEFPDELAIANRILPICHEEALPSGASEECANLVAIATEMFIKGVVGNLLSLTRSNIPAAGIRGGMIETLDFKRTSMRTTPNKAAVSDQQMQSTLTGKGNNLMQQPLGIGDLRMGMNISGCDLGSMPDIVQDVLDGYPEGLLEGWDAFSGPPEATIPIVNDALPLEVVSGSASQVTGALLSNEPDGIYDIENPAAAKSSNTEEMSAIVNAFLSKSHPVAAHPPIDQWAGSGGADREKLLGVLDECLAIGK